MAGSAAPPGKRVLRDPDQLLAWLAAIGVTVVVLLRVAALRDMPLGLDETFTAVISGQPSWAGFARQAWLDIAAPLYYFVMWLLPGDSNLALRLPSFLFMLAAPAVVLWWRIPGQERGTRILWAALLVLWIPGARFAFDARCYGLLFLLSTLQTIAFARLLAAASLRRAMLWTAFAALTILTHYLAGALGLAQGLILIIMLRRRILPLWPALLPLLVPAVELLIHLPRLAVYAQSDTNWLPPVTAAQVPNYLLYGVGPFAVTLLAIAGVTRVLNRDEPFSRPAALAACSGVLATLLLIAAGWGRPLLIERYLVGCAPAMLLGVATLGAGSFGRYALLGLNAALAIAAALIMDIESTLVGLQRPAELLIPSRPAQLIFSLGYKQQDLLAVDTTKGLGEFYFRRAGLPTRARLVHTVDGRDLIPAAGQHAAILWIYPPKWQPVASQIARQRPCFQGAFQLSCPALSSLPKR